MPDSHVLRIGTSAVIVSDDKSVLFVKRSETDEFLPGNWELPGGGTEKLLDLKDHPYWKYA